MGAYLIDHPPVRDQFYRTRNRPLTGCTVLHTAESVMDVVGPDTGAEAVAEFIRTRTTPGSYHDLADSDSWLRVVPLESGAYHDGTGSNNWALSLSFACRTTDWDRMSPEQRRGFLRQGARAFADQQAWRRAHGLQLTLLRRISKAQSDRGESGFIYHGDRDPGRRTDPGVSPPNDFPFDEFITECAIALGIIEEDDFMPELSALEQRQLFDRVTYTYETMTPGESGRKPPGRGYNGLYDAALLSGVDEAELVAALKPLLAEAVQAGQSADAGATADEIVDEIVARLGKPVSDSV